MSEEEKVDGALESTPLETIVDTPKLTETTPSVVEDKPEPRQKREPKPDKPVIPEGYVPLREVLDTRDRAKKAEEDRDRYKTAWDEHQRKLAAEADKDPAPDMFKDPRAYNAWVDRQVNKRAEAIAKQQVAPIMEQVSAQTLRLSEMAAEKHLGAERWARLNEWIGKQDEGFRAWAMSQPDPYWAAYEQFRQRTTFEKLGNDDLETYEQKLRAQIMAELKGPVDPREPAFEDDDPTPQQSAPRSFANGRNADPTKDKGSKFAGPKPLGELLAAKPQQNKR